MAGGLQIRETQKSLVTAHTDIIHLKLVMD